MATTPSGSDGVLEQLLFPPPKSLPQDMVSLDLKGKSLCPERKKLLPEGEKPLPEGKKPRFRAPEGKKPPSHPA